MNYADIKEYDVANGTGIRVSLFVSGCTHKCKSCFNEIAWDFNYGTPFTETQIEQIITYLKPNYVSGLSLLGGEPFEPQNREGLLPLIKRVKEVYPEKDIWCFTGYLFDAEILGNMCESSETVREMIADIDILVDGKFMEEKKDLQLKFRGSSNQRIIDVKNSLASGNVILWKERR